MPVGLAERIPAAPKVAIAEARGAIAGAKPAGITEQRGAVIVVERPTALAEENRPTAIAEENRAPRRAAAQPRRVLVRAAPRRAATAAAQQQRGATPQGASPSVAATRPEELRSAATGARLSSFRLLFKSLCRQTPATPLRPPEMRPCIPRARAEPLNTRAAARPSAAIEPVAPRPARNVAEQPGPSAAALPAEGRAQKPAAVAARPAAMRAVGNAPAAPVAEGDR